MNFGSDIWMEGFDFIDARLDPRERAAGENVSANATLAGTGDENCTF